MKKHDRPSKTVVAMVIFLPGWPPAHSVNHMFSFLCVFVVLVVSHLGFKGVNLVLMMPLSGYCFPLTSHETFVLISSYNQRDL